MNIDNDLSNNPAFIYRPIATVVRAVINTSINNNIFLLSLIHLVL